MTIDRIVTTHVGSLPRGPDVVALLFAREFGEPYDPARFDATMHNAVDDAVRQQVATGIDLVSDGETAKIGYATYIKDRLSGFDGDSPRQIALDLRPFAEFRERMGVFAGKQSFKRQVCVGPIAVKERESMHKDIANLRAAAAKHGPTGAFMNAASPGVVSAFQTNQYYPTHEAYVEALGAAMQEEYEAIHAAGLLLQIDMPDIAMARHTGFQDLTEAQFLKRAEHQVDVLNHALRNIPADRLRMHICWGNYEGPHTHDIALEKIMHLILKAKPAHILFEASNPRHAHEWAIWRNTVLPDDKILVPGCITSTSNYVEHPELIAQRLVQFAHFAGRERVQAGTDCGFGTFAGVGKMDAGISWLKLRALVEGAEIATRRLWSAQAQVATG
jgi:5-methyltetrahydropteroyltriglutamate--homocysteine methyltransferase